MQIHEFSKGKVLVKRVKRVNVSCFHSNFKICLEKWGVKSSGTLLLDLPLVPISWSTNNYCSNSSFINTCILYLRNFKECWCCSFCLWTFNIYSGTCLIQHTKGPGKCVGLYRMSENSGVGLHKFHCTINYNCLLQCFFCITINCILYMFSLQSYWGYI